jgi:hypothetical protein
MDEFIHSASDQALPMWLIFLVLLSAFNLLTDFPLFICMCWRLWIAVMFESEWKQISGWWLTRSKHKSCAQVSKRLGCLHQIRL